jgi:hypothetical protein
VSSATAQQGDTVALVVADDVIVNGYVVMARGADGLGEIERAWPASANSSGNVLLAAKWVRAVDGSKIGVNGELTVAGRGPSGRTDGAATVSNGVQAASSTVAASTSGGTNAAANLVGSVSGLFGHLNRLRQADPKGTDAAIEPVRSISVEVRNPNGVTIVSSQKASRASPASPGADNDIK